MPRPSRCLGAHTDCPVCTRTVLPLILPSRRIRVGRPLRFGGDAKPEPQRPRRALIRPPRRSR